MVLRWEFTAAHSFTASDEQTTTVAELLALAGTTLDEVGALHLGYRPTYGTAAVSARPSLRTTRRCPRSTSWRSQGRRRRCSGCRRLLQGRRARRGHGSDLPVHRSRTPGLPGGGVWATAVTGTGRDLRWTLDLDRLRAPQALHEHLQLRRDGAPRHPRAGVGSAIHDRNRAIVTRNIALVRDFFAHYPEPVRVRGAEGRLRVLPALRRRGRPGDLRPASRRGGGGPHPPGVDLRQPSGHRPQRPDPHRFRPDEPARHDRGPPRPPRLPGGLAGSAPGAGPPPPPTTAPSVSPGPAGHPGVDVAAREDDQPRGGVCRDGVEHVHCGRQRAGSLRRAPPSRTRPPRSPASPPGPGRPGTRPGRPSWRRTRPAARTRPRRPPGSPGRCRPRRCRGAPAATRPRRRPAPGRAPTPGSGQRRTAAAVRRVDAVDGQGGGLLTGHATTSWNEA